MGCVLLPLAVMTDAAWGIGGELRPTDYPASYPAARAALADAKGDLVVLPFTSYRAPEWNGGRKVLDPLGRYLEPNYVVSDELSISGRIVAGEDPRVPEVLEALRLADPEDRATALGRLGVRLVARERDAVGAGDPPYDAEVAGTRVYRRPADRDHSDRQRSRVPSRLDDVDNPDGTGLDGTASDAHGRDCPGGQAPGVANGYS